MNPALQQIPGCLVAQTGARAGTRYTLAGPATRIGRSPENDIVIDGDEASIVSLRHAEVVREGGGFRVRDLNSTNGTFVDGRQITDVCLIGPATIRLGMTGPEFSLVFEEAGAAPVELNKTVVVPRSAAPLPMPDTEPMEGTFDGLLTDAVTRARKARARGISNETIFIMREALGRALHTTRRRSRRIIIALAVTLLIVSAAAGWKIWDLHREKRSIDQRIQEIEAQLQRAWDTGANTDSLIERLERYQGEARQLQRSVFYRLAGRPEEDLVTGEIRTLMNEFGAEVYSVPPEFTDRVKYYLGKYQAEDRPLMAHALAEGRQHLDTVRSILAEEQLPPDLAWIPVVESALRPGESAAGAAGPWQFTVSTARAYGLRVDKAIDERRDLRKATRSACKYLRELILDFGSGSSVMLALAAYNSGPGKVKHAVMKTVRDPIKQRNFWYLYRVRALPAETREYVPKVAAVMIIGRNPGRFGFEAESK
ncbi:MAG TPA: FHA domain-containing protein [Bryobacteraceae bacterium]|nr:FHA domain-containing protein [Bryobacteraceae bacterium]